MKIKHAVLAMAMAFSVGAANAQSEVNLTLSGGNPGGLWSLLGAGIDRAAKEANPSSVVTYQATGGGFANIALLGQGRTDLGLVHDAEVQIALAGEEPFNAPVTNMQAIGYMYNWAPMHFFLRRDIAEQYGITSLADIAESGAAIRIGVNRPGNITANVALGMLEAAGATVEVIEGNGGSIVRAGANDQADLLRDGRIDMVTNGVFVLHSSFRAIDENNEVVVLSIPDDVMEMAGAAFGTTGFVIPGGSYRFQPDDVNTQALGAMLVTHDGADEEAIYRLTNALVEHIDEVRAVHNSMQALDRELFATQSILPYHPGAERALREAGLIQ
ncbi:MAG: TAXI family TRAP transporter solute-binding subunit [Pararhodobacter sp.]|nr:TAXI family TRAP transporter solute-binding subunit [Pararhodobacter sp.]